LSKISQIEQELPKGRGLYLFRIYNTKSEIVSKISKDLKNWFNEEKTGSTLNAYANAAGYRLDVNFVQ